MDKALTIIERIVIPHTAFANAQRQIEQCFTFSAGMGARARNCRRIWHWKDQSLGKL